LFYSTLGNDTNYESKVKLVNKAPRIPHLEQQLISDRIKSGFSPSNENNKRDNSVYSPSENDTVRHMNRILGDGSNADVIKEDEEEHSEKDLTNGKDDYYLSEIPGYISKTIFKRSVVDPAVVANADRHEEKSIISQGNLLKSKL
jgi:hypothetical protein